LYKTLKSIVSTTSDWISIIFFRLDAPRRDESNDGKTIPIDSILTEVLDLKFYIIFLLCKLCDMM